MGWLLDRWQESAARRELSLLAERLLGRAGLTLSGLAPGLLAVVDQHAAAVRDILTLGGSRLGVVELAEYARGIQDAAADSGWRLPDGSSWMSDWVVQRLIAVCLLAVAGPVLVAGDPDPLLPFF
jgi:uncharacterized protein DUF6401